MHFWQGTEVATRYYTSILMGHASAADLIKHTDTAVVKLSKNRIVQIGMDGPNVNWKLFKDLQKNETHTQVDIGFSAEKLLHKHVSMKTKKITDRDVFCVRQDAKSMLIAVCKKMMTPMTYVTAWNMMCLDLRLMHLDQINVTA